jgi:hypothetical protein
MRSTLTLFIVFAATACTSAPRPATVIDPSANHVAAQPNAEPTSSAQDAGEDLVAVTIAQDATDVPGEPPSEERLAFEQAKPVFDKFCADCHTTTGRRSTTNSRAHFSMDGYPFGGHHTTSMGPTIRKVLGMTGRRAVMPRDNPGAVQGDELARVLVWADAWDKAQVAGLHAQP